MYTNPIAGQTAPQSETARICGLRKLIMDLLLPSRFITSAEWGTANGRVHACTNVETLAKWYRNTVIEIANREEGAPAPEPITYATGEQKTEIIRLLNHPAISRRHKTRVLVGINRLLIDDARDEIARLTAYIADPFGGGPTGAVNASGELVGFSLVA